MAPASSGTRGAPAQDLEFAMVEQLVNIPAGTSEEIIDTKHFAARIEQNGAKMRS